MTGIKKHSKSFIQTIIFLGFYLPNITHAIFFFKYFLLAAPTVNV